MKRNIIQYTLCTAALLTAGCTQEDTAVIPNDGEVQPLFVTVTDGGYIIDGKADPVTRATENGYRTEFTAGDACGLYIVRDGEFVAENVKLIATETDGSGIAWQPETGIQLFGGFLNEHYFLYYPYQVDMEGKVDISKVTDTDFFAPLISNWTVQTDQSNYTAYTASDLMTAKGEATRNDNTLVLSFSMSHRMSLAVIDMPKTVYQFTGTNLPECVVAVSTDFSKGDLKPCHMTDGTYRCLIVPKGSYSIEGSYENGRKEFSISNLGDIGSGYYKTYLIEGAKSVEKEYTLQLGDFYCINEENEGYVLPQEATYELINRECVGVVFALGHSEYDKSDYSATGIGQEKCHGYAVALSEAETRLYTGWGTQNIALGLYPEGVDNLTNPDQDWDGYLYTRKIVDHVGGEEMLKPMSGATTDKEQDGYPATYYAVVAYKNLVAAPTNSSGWFLPAIGQLLEVFRQGHFVTTVGAPFNEHSYWSSSEDANNPAQYALRGHHTEIKASQGEKWRPYNGDHAWVRSVLAF